MRRILAPSLVIFLCAASHLLAAETYQTTETFQGWPEDDVETGTVLVEGSRYRFEIDPSDDDSAQVYDVLIGSTDSDAPVAVHRENHTYYWLVTEAKPTVGLFKPLMPTYRVRDVEVEATTREREPVDGLPTREVEIHASFNVDTRFPSEIVRAEFEVTASFLLTDAIDAAVPRPLQALLVTGYPEVDEEIAALGAALDGFPLRQQVSVQRSVVGGNSETATLTRTFTVPEPTEAAPDAFSIPDGFVEQEPVVSGPGGSAPRRGF